MRSKHIQFLVFGWFFFCSTQILLAQPVLQIGEQFQSQVMGRYFLLLEDEKGTLTIENVSSGKTKPYRFIRIFEDVPNLGSSSSVYWLRMKLQNTTAKRKEMFLETNYPTIDENEFFAPLRNGKWRRSIGGDAFPFKIRKIKLTNPVFLLSLAPQETKVFYLRVKTSSTVQLDYILWSPLPFIGAKSSYQLAYGVLYGLMLAMFFFNFLIFLVNRDLRYFLYCLSVLTGFLFSASYNGHAFQFFWSDYPILTSRIHTFTIASFGFSTTVFSRYFLRTYKQSSSIDFHMLLVLLVCLLSMGSAFFLPIRLAIVLSMLVSLYGVVVILFSSIFSILEGYRPARYFFLSWIFFLGGVMLVALKGLGFLPVSWITQHGTNVGIALQLFLMSLALSQRTQVLRAEREGLLYEFKQSTERLLNIVQQIRQSTGSLSDYSLQMSRIAEEVILGAQTQAKATDKTGASVQEMSNTLQITAHRAEGLDRDVSNTTAVVEKMGKSADSVLQNTDLMTTHVTDVTSSFEHIARTVNKTTKRIEQASEYSSKMKELADTGAESVLQAVGGLQQLNSMMERIAVAIRSLQDQSYEIEGIIEFIDEIADQTNLLAINATIEAARAGEMGRGFAVVADEVRLLAEHSQQATKEIERLIHQVQKNTQIAVEVAEEGNQLSRNSIRVADKARSSIKNILQEVQEVASLMQELQSSTKDLYRRSQFVVDNVEGMNQITNRVKISIEEQHRGFQQIVEATNNVTQLTTEVRIAAQEQQLTGDHMLEEMGEIQRIARNNFSGMESLGHTSQSLMTESQALGNLVADFAEDTAQKPQEIEAKEPSHEEFFSFLSLKEKINQPFFREKIQNVMALFFSSKKK